MRIVFLIGSALLMANSMFQMMILGNKIEAVYLAVFALFDYMIVLSYMIADNNKEKN